jgi:hypothetical protein
MPIRPPLPSPRCTLVLLGFLLLAACTPTASLIDCQPVGTMVPHCGFTNPEDLAPLDGGRMIVVSEMGDLLEDGAKGHLSLFDTQRQERRELATSIESAGERWGDPQCPPPTRLNPHGIDIVQRSDGRILLLVVNHGDREAVEFFEILADDESWTAAWRGCAIPPGAPFLNDVTALPDGGFAATQFWERDSPMIEVGARLLVGADTGWVWAWSPQDGFRRVPGSDAALPNGIASSADGKFLFVDQYFEDRVVRLDRTTGEIDGSFEMRQPDNVVVAEDGSLWVAGHHQFVGDFSCTDIEGACPWQYSVARIDPATMEGEILFTHEGPPMGFATVALPVGDRLYLGSAAGDRIVSMPRPMPAQSGTTPTR